MQPYANEEIGEAIDRLAGDVARRAAAANAQGPALQLLVSHLREMEAARRSGDVRTAIGLAAAVAPELDGYRPTNSTSRAKAVLTEVVGALLTADDTQDRLT